MVTVSFVIDVRECVEADLDAAWDIRALAFDDLRAPDAAWRDGWAAGEWHGWVARVDGLVSAFARVWPLWQHFGGAAVPAAGVASVAVAPHARGGGVGRALMTAVLDGTRSRGYAVGTLYPSVPSFYRALGWEFVGVCEWVSVAPEALRAVPHPVDPVPLRPASAHDVPALKACYGALARTVDGLLDRSSGRFDLARVLELNVVTVAAGAGGEVRGFLSASRSAPGLVVYDLVARDADAWRALLRSVGSWAGQVSTVRMRLAESRLVQPAFYGDELSAEQWMLRVIDLPAAVRARGWPGASRLRPGLSVDIEVVDDHAPWHAGRHRLVVDDGAVVVEAGGSGAVRLTARGLAAWYAGAAPVSALCRHGLLDGSPADAAILDALTASHGTPRLANQF